MSVAIVSRTTKTADTNPTTFEAAFLSDGGTTPDTSVHALVDSTKTLIDPATKQGQAAIQAALALLATDADVQAATAKIEAMRALLAGTLAISAAALPLPAGAATEATLAALKAAIQGTLAVSGSVAVSNLPATQAVSATALPLPVGAATETTLAAVKTAVVTPALPVGAATDTSLVAILNAIRAQIDLATLFLTDNGSPAKFYVRRENLNEGTGAITVIIENLDGSATTLTAAQIAALTPIVGASSSGGSTVPVTSTSTFFDVVTAATGYAPGDVLARVVLTNTATGAITSSWQNLTQGTTLASAPVATNLKEQTQNLAVTSTVLAANAATAALQQQIVTALGGVVLAGGSAVVGKVGIDQTTPGTTNKVSIGTDGTVALGAGTASIGGVDTVVKAAATSRSGTITTGGAAQAFAPANAARRGFSIQNQSSGPLYFSGVGNATLDNNSMVLQAGDYFETNSQHVGTAAISIIGATTGQAFYGREF